VKIELNRDWTEFLRLLISRRVKFLLIGGHAVAGHGEPRLTEDLDVFVDRSAENAKRLREALVDFGFGSVAPPSKELSRPHKVFMLGRKPWRIDILTSIDGVSFAEAWASRVAARFIATPLYVIGLEMLIKNSGPRRATRICAMWRCWKLTRRGQLGSDNQGPERAPCHAPGESLRSRKARNSRTRDAGRCARMARSEAVVAIRRICPDGRDHPHCRL